MKSIVERIAAYNQARLPEMLPVKNAALRQSVFRFYRGTCHIFYEDLANDTFFTNGPKTWICGDLHLENYGTYKGNNRLVYFDINDFDECCLSPVALEIVRMVSSIYVAAEDLNVEKARADETASRFMSKYFATLIAGKPHSFQRETAPGIIGDFIIETGKRKDKELLEKRTMHRHGVIELAIVPGKTWTTPDKKSAEIREAFVTWNQSRNKEFKLIDIASRIMGTGSLGLERYILLCLHIENDKFVLLDLKEAGSPCILDYFHFEQPSWKNDAYRVVKIQTLLQDTPPALLGEFTIAEKSYVIKELQPSQDKLDLEVVAQKAHKFEGFIDVIADITASAHLRAAGRYTSHNGDELIAAAEHCDQQRLLKYARDYATRVESYFKEFVASH